MLRREFLAGTSAVSIAKSPKNKGASINDALILLEKAVRLEFSGIEEIKIVLERDETKRIALLFSAVRRSPSTCPKKHF